MKLNKYRSLIKSYVFGELVESVESKVNGILKVYRIYGKYILNAENANYSYGELHKGFRKIFKKLNLKKRQFKTVLLLGFGCGSVVSILHEELKKDCRITAVDIDPVVMTLGNKYFNIKRFNNLKISITDAEKFIKSNTEQFDLVVFDVYVDLDIPSQFATQEFFYNLKSSVAQNGLLVYNKDLNSAQMQDTIGIMEENFAFVFPKFQKISIGRNNVFYCWENH